MSAQGSRVEPNAAIRDQARLRGLAGVRHEVMAACCFCAWRDKGEDIGRLVAALAKLNAAPGAYPLPERLADLVKAGQDFLVSAKGSFARRALDEALAAYWRAKPAARTPSRPLRTRRWWLDKPGDPTGDGDEVA